MAVDVRALQGDLLWFEGDPYRDGRKALRRIPDGMILVQGGKIAAIDETAYVEPYLPAGAPVASHPDCFIMPGFVDAHVHYPQAEVIAAPAANLLNWLDTHTFPAEMRYSDPALAKPAAAFFLDRLLAYGTTTAAVFCTTAPESVDALFEEAQARGMRLAGGKTMMDRNAPDGLLDDVESSETDTRDLIGRWHGQDRLAYAITPRFAVTSTSDQLQAAGRLAAEFDQCIVHTHLSESEGELARVAELFPEDPDYTSVYASRGLLRAPTLLAHGIHLSESEFQLLHQSGASLVHCPTSNTFLGSGLMDLKSARDPDRPVPVALGTDVGGGTSLSMLGTMAEAYKVAKMRGESLDPFDLLHMATRGGALAMGLGDKVGSLQVGMEADFVVLDPAATDMLAWRMQSVGGLADAVFAMMFLGDDRVVRETWVAGRQVRGAVSEDGEEEAQ